MADTQAEIDKLGGGSSEDSGSQRAEIFHRPSGWRGFYSHPKTQVCMLGLVCFMCPGMFNALTGLGGGGQVNSADQANSSTAVYSTFAFFGFFSGSVRSIALILSIASDFVVVPLTTSLDLDALSCSGPGATHCILLHSCKKLFFDLSSCSNYPF